MAKMMRSLNFWIPLLWLVLGSLANAQEVPKEYRAEDMLKLCTGTVSEEDQGAQSLICTFRLQGVIQMMTANCETVEHGFNPAPFLSAEAPPSGGASRQTFINFMEANPDRWGMPWDIVVAMAISESFPCTR
jgi:hypothetical protein